MKIETGNKIQSYRILIWSENPDKLVGFYNEVLGLETVKKYELEDDYRYAVKVNDNMLIWIGEHSEIKGKAKEPFRHIINLYVNDVFEWYDKLKSRDDVEIVSKPVKTPPSDPKDPRYVFTFLDPEGNCLQFMNP